MDPIDLLAEKQDGFQLFGQCGVHMKINSTHESFWTLRATVNDYIENDLSFFINVHKLEKEDEDDMVSSFMFNLYYYMFLSIHASLESSRRFCDIYTYIKNYKIFRCTNVESVSFFYEAQDYRWMFIYHFPFILFHYQRCGYAIDVFVSTSRIDPCLCISMFNAAFEG